MPHPPEPQRPFASRRQSRRERRASERRARERQAAWAAAMPPPNPGQRVDPLTGQPTGPAGTEATTSPQATTGPARPDPFADPRAAGVAAPAATAHPQPATRQEPRRAAEATGSAAARRRPVLPRRRPRHPAVLSDAGLPSLNAVAARTQRTPLWRRVLEPWPGRVGALALYLGSPLAAGGAMTAAGAGLPVLDHGWDWPWLGAGAAVAAVAVAAASRGWAAAGPRLRLVVPALALLLTVAFCVGLGSGPVVVDGKVYVATSRTARSAKAADQMRTDLYALVAYDDLLAAAQEDARANVSAYEPAERELVALSARYAQQEAATLPDPALAGPAEKIKTAAYWGAKAMRLKRELIEQNDAKKAADLDSYRATYAGEVLAGGDQLARATAELGIPFTMREEGPHE